MLAASNFVPSEAASRAPSDDAYSVRPTASSPAEFSALENSRSAVTTPKTPEMSTPATADAANYTASTATPVSVSTPVTPATPAADHEANGSDDENSASQDAEDSGAGEDEDMDDDSSRSFLSSQVTMDCISSSKPKHKPFLKPKRQDAGFLAS